MDAHYPTMAIPDDWLMRDYVASVAGTQTIPDTANNFGWIITAQPTGVGRPTMCYPYCIPYPANNYDWIIAAKPTGVGRPTICHPKLYMGWVYTFLSSPTASTAHAAPTIIEFKTLESG